MQTQSPTPEPPLLYHREKQAIYHCMPGSAAQKHMSTHTEIQSTRFYCGPASDPTRMLPSYLHSGLWEGNVAQSETLQVRVSMISCKLGASMALSACRPLQNRVMSAQPSCTTTEAHILATSEANCFCLDTSCCLAGKHSCLSTHAPEMDGPKAESVGGIILPSGLVKLLPE